MLTKSQRIREAEKFISNILHRPNMKHKTSNADKDFMDYHKTKHNPITKSRANKSLNLRGLVHEE